MITIQILLSVDLFVLANMKYLIVTFVVCFACAFALQEMSEEFKAQIKQYKVECLAKTGVDPAVFEAIEAGKEYEINDKINCLATCMLTKVKMMRPDGTLDKSICHQIMLYQLSEEEVAEVFDKCKDLVGKDICETGGKFARCFREYKAL